MAHSLEHVNLTADWTFYRSNLRTRLPKTYLVKLCCCPQKWEAQTEEWYAQLIGYSPFTPRSAAPAAAAEAIDWRTRRRLKRPCSARKERSRKETEEHKKKASLHSVLCLLAHVFRSLFHNTQLWKELPNFEWTKSWKWLSLVSLISLSLLYNKELDIQSLLGGPSCYCASNHPKFVSTFSLKKYVFTKFSAHSLFWLSTWPHLMKKGTTIRCVWLLRMSERSTKDGYWLSLSASASGLRAMRWNVASPRINIVGLQ